MFRLELDRLRLEFAQLQRAHKRRCLDNDSLRRHLVRLRRWIAHVEKFRRKFLVVPDPAEVRGCP